MNYGERLRYARETVCRISQKELSQRSGVTQKSISKIEVGETGLSKYNLPLARALGVSPDWLANGTEPIFELDANGERVAPPPVSSVAEITVRYVGRDAEFLNMLAAETGLSLEEIGRQLINAGIPWLTQQWQSLKAERSSDPANPSPPADRRTQDQPVEEDQRTGERRLKTRPGIPKVKEFIDLTPRSRSPRKFA